LLSLSSCIAFVLVNDGQWVQGWQLICITSEFRPSYSVSATIGGAGILSRAAFAPNGKPATAHSITPLPESSFLPMARD